MKMLCVGETGAFSSRDAVKLHCNLENGKTAHIRAHSKTENILTSSINI